MPLHTKFMGALLQNQLLVSAKQITFLQAKQYSDATNAESTPTAVDGAIPAFNVMDLSLSYNWRHFTFYTGINNLADKKYFTRRADGYPGPDIIPADI